MSAIKLYEISNAFRALEVLGESEDLPAEVIADTLDGLEGDFEVKALEVGRFVLGLEAQGDAIQNAADAMHTRGARVHKRAEGIRAYLQFHMQATQIKRVAADDIVMKLIPNPGSVCVTDEASIPAEYWEDIVPPPPPPKRLNKAAIAKALRAGKDVPGAHLDAGDRLEIKP